MTEKAIHPFERMIVVLSRLVRDGEIAAVGTLSPLPAAALYLAQLHHASNMEPLVYGDPDMRITDGLHEFFGLAQRGLIDLFFLSGIQIDQRGNFNLSVIGDYYKPKLRLPGGAGSNMMIMMAKRTIFFTITHTKKLFVPRVDFVNGSAQDDTVPWRRGSFSHCVTPLALLRFDKTRGQLILDATYHGIGTETVAENTGFDLDTAGRTIPEIDPVTEEELSLLRGPTLQRLRRVYPLFCDMVWT
jgi:glutaconate CoA-transferase subunit B